VLFLLHVAPQIQEAYDSFRVPRHALLSWFVRLGETAGTWGPIVPLVLLLLVALWWWQSGRAILVDPRRAAWTLGWLPWIGKMITWSRGAMFAEVFALLLEHDVPLDEALTLAAKATGDAGTIRTAGNLAQAIQRGEPVSAQMAGLPPILGWLLTCQPEQGLLLSAARHAADSYGWRARYQADLVRLMLPVLLTAIVAGTVTLLYAAALFVPWANLLRSLS